MKRPKGHRREAESFAYVETILEEWVLNPLRKDYGIDNSTNYAQIVANKGELPLKAGSVIWKKSEVGYKDDDKTIVDETTADYIVKGVADEGMSEDLFLLQRNVK